MKILAIDDNPDDLSRLQAMLSDRLPEAALLTAPSGPQGVALARAEDPDVIPLLDVVMPGLDGYAVCRTLKQDERLPSIPVLFLTAVKTARESRIKALDAGAERFFSRPFDEVELSAQVRAMAAIRALVAGETEVFEEAYRIRCKDGSWKHILDRALAARNTDGSVIRMAGSETDISELKRNEVTQAFLLRCGMPGTGEDFFASLARHMAETLHIEYVCIDRPEGDGLTAQTVAVFNRGTFVCNVSYALDDTPCGEVVGKSVCCYPRGVRQVFPRDAALEQLQAESYVGTTLVGSTGQPIGLIALIGHRPLTDPQHAEAMLRLVAPRAAGELERRQVEAALRESEDKLKYVFDHSLIGKSLTTPTGELSVNHAFCDMVGYSPEELRGRSW